MQATNSHRVNGSREAHALLLAAVGVLGLSIGRWVVPATDSAPPIAYRPVAASTSSLASSNAERKLIQMDAADDARTRANSEAHDRIVGGSSAGERKLIQMDAADDARTSVNTDASGLTGD